FLSKRCTSHRGRFLPRLGKSARGEVGPDGLTTSLAVQCRPERLAGCLHPYHPLVPTTAEVCCRVNRTALLRSRWMRTSWLPFHSAGMCPTPVGAGVEHRLSPTAMSTLATPRALSVAPPRLSVAARPAALDESCRTWTGMAAQYQGNLSTLRI